MAKTTKKAKAAPAKKAKAAPAKKAKAAPAKKVIKGSDPQADLDRKAHHAKVVSEDERRNIHAEEIRKYREEQERLRKGE